MEKATETTFKDLQQDERYKRLERTLKMVLLKNNDAGSGCPSAWPSISSINGDHLDTSCAQSVQSSRFGSEIVSSSLNLRNILSHKKSSFPPCRDLATSSENQFPIDKDNDSVIMPPPKTPGPSRRRSGKSGVENKREPLLNVSMNLDGNNGFARSLPSVGNSAVSQRLRPADAHSGNGNFGEKNDFPRRNVRDESDGDRRSPKPRERIFSGWRVMLNDKAQLIIKGTLECGKTARSKPVIRRLDANSVQSVFKHTYRLRGNLVDERNELPDYVSGKFYNGFPDDWENVYQVWRNYVSDGSKLSFRWPTPITDSDDDITSEITEISYQPRFEKLEESRSPRKRQRYETKIDDNYTKKNQCSSAPASRISRENSSNLSCNLSQSSRARDASVGESTKVERNKSLQETSFDGNQRAANNSLKDIIQEDKLNIIIDNLTNKNCSLEYIKKIVEMFDCLKYLVSYRTPDESNDSESASKNHDSSCTRKTENHSIEEKRDNVSRSSAKPFENRRSADTVADSPVATAKLQREPRTVDDARRKLTRNDYESEDSDDDFFVARKRTSLDRRSNERTEPKSHAFEDLQPRIEQRYRDRERSSLASRQLRQPSEARSKSLSEEFSTVQRFNAKDPRDRAIARPRKSAVAENGFHGTLDRYDSSVSLTEDENAVDFRKESRKTRDENYDSSVSITEDQGDLRIDRNAALETLNYYSESNSRDPSASKDDALPAGQKETLKYSNRSNSSSIDSGIDRNPHDRRNFLKPSSAVASIRLKEHSRSSKDYSEDFSQEHREDSAYLSLDAKRQKESSTIATATETESSGRKIVFRRDFDNVPVSSDKSFIQQAKKKPLVVACEPANIDIRKYCTKNDGKNDIVENERGLSTERSASRRSIDEIKATEKEQRDSANLTPDSEKLAARATKKGNVNEQNYKTDAGDFILEKGKSEDSSDKSSDAKFGSEKNPKKLTGWVPAVICEDDSQCRLVFEGKLINEAGHVANRKFTTNFVKRRVNPKLIETVDRVFYQLVGDFNDTKHVVPKDLVKQCHNGCPSKINHFCEKWKLSAAGNNGSPTNVRLHNTSVDCLSVPTSSRGRRILPPLNYWTGERITTKDNKAIYNPGNFQEASVTSSLEKTNEDFSSERKSPRAGARRFPNRETKEKRADVPAMDGVNKKDTEKPSSSPTTRKSPTKESPRRTRNGKRRLVRQTRDSSSESDEVEAKRKLPLRKRRLRSDDPAPSAKSTSKTKLKNPGKNTTSSQSLEQSTSSISFEKPAAPDAKSKLRKRRKINQDQVQTAIAGASKQSPRRGPSEVTCTLYRNVPLLSGDLSEDQLSTV